LHDSDTTHGARTLHNSSCVVDASDRIEQKLSELGDRVPASHLALRRVPQSDAEGFGDSGRDA